MFFASKIEHTYGYYDFDPAQFYLIKTKDGPLVLRMEYMANGVIIRDFVIEGIESISNAVTELDNDKKNIKVTILTKNESLIFTFVKRTKHEEPRYSLRILKKYFGYIPYSIILSFKPKVSSAQRLLQDIESNMHKLSSISKII